MSANTAKQKPSGLLPVSEWPEAARTDEFYNVLFEGGFRDAEDLARFLLRVNAGLHERIRALKKERIVPQ